MLFARRYRDLSHAIESARTRLADARERETAAAARVAEVESDISRLRIEVAEADARATAARDTAHAHELEIQRTAAAGRAEQAADRDASTPASPTWTPRWRRSTCAASRIRVLSPSAGTPPSGPSRSASRPPNGWPSRTRQYQIALRDIEGLEGDVEAARSEVFTAINAATALQHAIESAAAARERAQEGLSRLDVEETDLRSRASGWRRIG